MTEKNKSTAEKAAQSVELQSLAQKLQAMEMPITDEEIERAKNL